MRRERGGGETRADVRAGNELAAAVGKLAAAVGGVAAAIGLPADGPCGATRLPCS